MFVEPREQHQRTAARRLDRRQRRDRHAVEQAAVERRAVAYLGDRHERRHPAARQERVGKLVWRRHRAHAHELGGKTEPAAELRVHRRKQMLLELIGADAERRAQDRRQAARQPGDRDVEVGELLEPRQRGGVEQHVQEGAVHRSDRAQRFAAAPGGEIEILAVRPARGNHLRAHLVAHAEQRIDAGKRARAGADRERRLEREPVGERFVEAALPIAAVAAAREHDRVEHQRMIPKKPAPHLMRGGNRFSEKIMLHQKARAG